VLVVAHADFEPPGPLVAIEDEEWASLALDNDHVVEGLPAVVIAKVNDEAPGN
jgi:hypothetical protein